MEYSTGFREWTRIPGKLALLAHACLCFCSLSTDNDFMPSVPNQVACACIASAYFINTKRQGKALGFAVGVTLLALFAGWLVGTIVPLYLPMFFPSSLSPETTCALFSFVTLWFTSTFLK
mgnify:FL=1